MMSGLLAGINSTLSPVNPHLSGEQQQRQSRNHVQAPSFFERMDNVMALMTWL